MMGQPKQRAMLEEVSRLVAENREQCLWFLAPGFQPADAEAAVRALGYIERYGSKSAFAQARALRTWLQRNSSARSAD